MCDFKKIRQIAHLTSIYKAFIIKLTKEINAINGRRKGQLI